MFEIMFATLFSWIFEFITIFTSTNSYNNLAKYLFWIKIVCNPGEKGYNVPKMSRNRLKNDETPQSNFILIEKSLSLLVKQT
jgi:hypothetical protein